MKKDNAASPGLHLVDSRVIERRTEFREAAQGRVCFFRPGSAAVAGAGHLVDRSPSGFRARYEGKPLETGETVRFEYAGCSGAARVAWTRISADGAESGFFICS